MSDVAADITERLSSQEVPPTDIKQSDNVARPTNSQGAETSGSHGQGHCTPPCGNTVGQVPAVGNCPGRTVYVLSEQRARKKRTLGGHVG